jgi:hypothetical protein
VVSVPECMLVYVKCCWINKIPMFQKKRESVG